jgi:hypothetical protein
MKRFKPLELFEPFERLFQGTAQHVFAGFVSIKVLPSTIKDPKICLKTLGGHGRL